MAFVEKTDALIEKATLEEVNAAIRKTMAVDQFLTVYAGDFANTPKK